MMQCTSLVVIWCFLCFLSAQFGYTLQATNYDFIRGRKKRIIRFPADTFSYEIKWSLVFPFDPVTDVDSAIDFSHVIPFPFDKLYPEAVSKNKTKNKMTRSILPEKPAEFSKKSSERRIIYGDMKSLFKRMGLAPVSCMKQTICQVNQHSKDDLFTILLQTAFNPSLDPFPNEEISSFIEAEKNGIAQKDCSVLYPRCLVSPFSLLLDVLNILWE